MADRIGFLNDIVVAGVSLRDTYGIVPTGECVYNAPERDVEFIEVPGRNGDLIIDNGRFKNIEIKYPCSIAKDFPANVDGLRAFLASQLGYIRISDTYHPDEYRLGVYASGLETVNGTLNRVGSFNLIFNCKPQRFLSSGDEPVELLQMQYSAAVGIQYSWFTGLMPVTQTPQDLADGAFKAPAGYGFAITSYDANLTEIGTEYGTAQGVFMLLHNYIDSTAAWFRIAFDQVTTGDVANNVCIEWWRDDVRHEANSVVELTNPTLYLAKPLLTAHGGMRTSSSRYGTVNLQIGDIYVYTELLGTSTGTEDFTTYVDIEDEASYYVDTATGAVTPFNYSGANRVDGTSFAEYGVGLDKAVLEPGATIISAPTVNLGATEASPFAYIYPRWWTI